MSDTDIKDVVKEKYGQAALRVRSGGSACCGATAACGVAAIRSLPICTTACRRGSSRGSDARLARMRQSDGAGEAESRRSVLDLGSGGGIDVLLSAKRVGPTGKAYGLDMTDEMLALANENKRKAGAENVEFLKGEIEHIPLPDNSVDVIISNCVINLSADKDRVLREAFRVLKPGGRFAVSDVVPGARSRRRYAKACCCGWVAWRGRWEMTSIAANSQPLVSNRLRLSRRGFIASEDAREFLSAEGIDVDAIAPQVDGKFMSAFVRAVKPTGAGAKLCCGPGCCS